MCRGSLVDCKTCWIDGGVWFMAGPLVGVDEMGCSEIAHPWGTNSGV